MNKKAFLLSILLLNSILTISYETWFKKIESSLGRELIITKEKDIILAGWINSETNFNDISLTKIDSYGEVKWCKSFSGDKNDFIFDILSDDNFFYCIGISNSFEKEDYDLVILKLDYSGNLIWQKRFGTPSNERKAATLSRKDGTLILSLNEINTNSLIVININPLNGIINWQKLYPNICFDLLSIAEDKFGNLYFLLNGNDHYSYLLKTSSEGEPSWLKKLSYSKELWLTDIKITEELLLIGRAIDNTGSHLVILLMNYDGIPIKTKKITPFYPIIGIQKINLLSNGKILITSSFKKEESEANAWIINLDPDWNILWEKTFSIPDNGAFYQIKEFYEKCLIGIGTTYFNSFYYYYGFISKLNNIGSLEYICPIIQEFSSSSNGSFAIEIQDYEDLISIPYNLEIFDIFFKEKDVSIYLSPICSPGCQDIEILPSSISNGKSYEPYNLNFSASGGTPPYKFSIVSGKLPNGLNLSQDGTLSGIPAEGGDFSFTISAIDVNYCEGRRDYTLHIDINPPTISSVLKLTDPFRLKIIGTNFHQDLKVYIGEDLNPWTNLKYKNSSQIILKGGNSLKQRFPKGIPVEIKVVNPDGGEATYIFKR